MYDAISRPEEDMAEADANGLVGRFWVDGETRVTLEPDDQYYFWQLATVHSPVLP